MKKTMLMVGLVAMVATAFAGDKFGTVDMLSLVRNHPSYESNKKLLESTEADYKKRLDAMQADLKAIQDKGTKLADEYRNPMLAQQAKTKIEEELKLIQDQFMMAQQKLRSEALRNQQDLGDLEARLLKAQAEDLKTRIANYAEKNGYDMIFDASAALYAKDSFDVTDGVLKAMGVDPKAAQAKEQNESK